MSNRPRINLIPSSFDKMMENGSLVVLIVLWCLTIYAYINMPETIPVHFNASGEPDNFGKKSSVFFLPALSTIIFFGMSWLGKRVHLLNYPKPITEQNAERNYKIASTF